MKKLIALVALASVTSFSFAGDSSKLVVHEWGTFTSISGEDGVALDYRPLAGVSDLPSFVYTAWDAKGLRGKAEYGKACVVGNVRMETPVIYFYADHETRVSASVSFPQGRITEFYPRVLSGHSSEVNWGTFVVKPDRAGSPIRGTEESHYYEARKTDADLVRVCSPQDDEYEKFLFYRGVGSFELPVKVQLLEDGQKLRIEGLRGDAIVYENRHGEARYRIVSPSCRSSFVECERPDLPLYTGFWPIMDEDLEKILVEAGLYKKEAKAMIATWEKSWSEEGLRVLYVLPRERTDEVLPLKIAPEPTELVRVLVGRAEVITPELEADVVASVAKLGAEKVEDREAARKALAARGRFARPILEKALAKTRDVEVSARIRELLSK